MDCSRLHKLFAALFAVLGLFLVTAMFTACGDDDDTQITGVDSYQGEWTGKVRNPDVEYKLVINADRSGSLAYYENGSLEWKDTFVDYRVQDNVFEVIFTGDDEYDELGRIVYENLKEDHFEMMYDGMVSIVFLRGNAWVDFEE